MTLNVISDLNRANDAVFLIDLQSLIFRYVNDYACETLGYSREELLNMQVQDIDPLTNAASLEKISVLLRTQGCYRLKTCHFTKKGLLFPVEVNWNIFEYQGESFGLIIARDLTEHNDKEAEKQRLFDILEESADFIGSSDLNGKLLYHNRAAKRMVGLSDDADLSNMTIPDVHPAWATKQVLETAIPEVLSHGVWHGESALLHRNGHEISVFQTIVLHRDADGRPLFMSTIMHDLTERKQKEAQLSLLNYAFNYVEEAIYLIDENAQFVQVNEKACRDLGYTREELLHLKIFDIDPDYTPQHWQQRQDNIGKGILSTTLETRHKTKEGRIFPIEVRASHIAYQGQYYDIAMVRDISERKATEKQLSLLNYALNHIKEEVWLIDENARFHYVNQAACRSIGLAYQEMLQLSVPDIKPDYGLEQWRDDWQRTKTKGSFTFETSHKSKEEKIFPVEVNGNYFVFDGKSYSLALSHDITERKAAEKQLTLLNYALDHVKEAVWLIDEQAKFHYNNAEACRVIGYSREEMLKLGVPDIDPDYQLDIWPKHWQDLKANGSLFFESRHRTKEGHIFPVEINANYFEFDGKGYNLALMRDITERKQAQEALQRSEALLAEAQRIAHIGSWEIDFSSDKLNWSEETFRIWEIDPTQFGVTVEAFLETVHPEDQKKVADAYNASVANKTTYQIEHRLLFPDSRVKYITERGEPFYDENGKVIRFVGTAMDITERYHIEETLKFVAQRGWQNRNESFLIALTQYLAQLFQVDYVIIDKIGTPPTHAETVALYAKGELLPNMQYCLEGTPCNNVMTGKICCHPENVQQLFPEDSLLVELQIEGYAGLPLWDTAGDVIGLIAVMDSKQLKDTAFITSILQLVATSVAAELERQHSEQTLLAREREFRTLAENTPNLIVRYDREYRRVYINPAYEWKTGIFETPSARNKTPDQIWIPINITPKQYQAILQRIFDTGIQEDNVLLEWFGNDGQLISHSFTMTPEFDADGDVVSVLAIGHNMTDFKRAQARVEQSEQEFRTLAENMPANLSRYDEQGRLVYINSTLIASLAPEVLPIIGKTLTESFPGSEFALAGHKAIMTAIATGEEFELEVVLPNPRGEMRIQQVRHVAERDPTGQIIGIIAIGRDITERKRMEDELAARERELRILLDNSPSPIFRYDTQCRRIYVNPAVEKMIGKPAEKLLNQSPSNESILSRQEGEKLECALRQVIETGQVIEGEIECVIADGQLHYYHNRYAPELDSNGNVLSVILVAHDITERKQTEQLLYQREQEFRTLVDNLPTTVLRYNRHLQRIYANSAYLQIMGGTEAELRNKSLEQTWLATNIPIDDYKAILTKVMQDGEKQDVSLEWTDSSSELICHALKIVPEYAIDGQIQTALVLGFDFSQQRRQQLIETNRQHVFEKMARNRKLNEILAQVALYMESTKAGCHCAILLLDENKNHLKFTAAPSFPKSYSIKNKAQSLYIKNKYCHEFLISALGKERVIIENVHEHPYLVFCLPFIQEIGAVACWSEPILSSSNQLLGMVTVYLTQAGVPNEHDLAHLQKAGHLSAIAIERKRIEQQMEHQASYDALTELPNRSMFLSLLHEEISRAERRGHKLAILFIDLDHFKDVNDTLGHEVGDSLLTEAAQRIRQCVRKSDTAARLGGDEFVVILPEINKMSPLERIVEAIISAMTQPFILGEYRTYISASVGIAVYPQDANNAEMLISCADQAMYAAKESGRNNFHFFTHSMQEQARQRLYLINNLREALEKSQFEVHYQPIIEVASGKAVKAEALLRWRHPVLGMVSPAIFIPLAEETDLIQDIGSWVFCQAADMAKHWNGLSGENEHRKVSINMSPRQLIKGSGDQIVIDYLQAIDLDSTYVVVEITEGLLLDDSPHITEKLERLSTKGIELSLDDFGTGYSAMAYLKKFDINYLKIDRSFVRELETNVNDRAITEAIIVMAHRLGLKVIAEGVETQGQHQLLAAVGCEYIQGYFYAKPMPPVEFLSYVFSL
jgi:diguanylate cyclase (GGDEF)-like protein/PAS domain S-box-containing protein